MVTNVNTLVDEVPDATDGTIITSGHHNKIKAALRGLASLIAPTSIPASTITFVPAFNGLPTITEWWRQVGGAVLPTPDAGTGPSARVTGWMPVAFADGTLIKSMTVLGTLTSMSNSVALQFSLLRVSVDANAITMSPPAVLKLIQIPPPNAVGVDPFGASYDVDSSLSTYGNVGSVDNKNYKYVLTADVTNLTYNTNIGIHAFQVVCTPPGR